MRQRNAAFQGFKSGADRTVRHRRRRADRRRRPVFGRDARPGVGGGGERGVRFNESGRPILHGGDRFRGRLQE